MSAEPTRRLPRIVDGALDAAGCDLDHLERELGRLARLFDRDHQGSRLPPLPTHDLDPHVVAVVVGYTAAAPVWSAALSALAGLDAAVVVTGCRDFATWDAAVAAPLAAWSVNAEVDGAEPPLREQARAAMAAQRAALRAVVSGGGASAGAASVAGLWDDAAGLAELEATIGRRREELAALGAALDEAAGEAAPRHAAALALAGRALVARALVRAVSDWLAELDVAADHPIRVLARGEAERVASVARAVERNVAQVAGAVAGLVGLEV